MRKIKTIKDIVDWGLCIGCGACSYFCEKEAVTLSNIDSAGIRPSFRGEICSDCTDDCLSVCPGFIVGSGWERYASAPDDDLIGSYLEIWEGYAADPDIRYAASSGGALSALSLFGLEKENMRFILHIGMNRSNPLENTTIQSRSKSDLIANAGSRYAPASPCDSLDLIENSDGPCVFIGKPCDAAAVALARKQRPKLDRNLGLLLTFFCAGTPSSRATRDLITSLGIPLNEINRLRYRGEGWPGRFKVHYGNDSEEASAAGNAAKPGQTSSLSYKESWSFLQRYRPFRCNLCPDGLGEFGDISCGDAWHRYPGDTSPGRSLIMARTERGREILHKALEAGYLTCERSSSADVIAAQGLVDRRMEIYGRLLAMRLLMVPATRFEGMPLYKAWMRHSKLKRLKTIGGTLRRLLLRGLWHRNPLS